VAERSGVGSCRAFRVQNYILSEAEALGQNGLVIFLTQALLLFRVSSYNIQLGGRQGGSRCFRTCGRPISFIWTPMRDAAWYKNRTTHPILESEGAPGAHCARTIQCAPIFQKLRFGSFLAVLAGRRQPREKARLRQ